jgi:hypothetical protein
MRNFLIIIVLIPTFGCVNYPVDSTRDLYEMESVWQYLKIYSIWQERVPKSAFEYESSEIMLLNMHDTLKGYPYTLYDNVTCGAGVCGHTSGRAGAVHGYGTVFWDSLTDSTALVRIYPEFMSDTYDSLLTAMLAMNQHHFFPKIILDLRQNRGGDIEATDSIIEAILPPQTPYLVETYRKYDAQRRRAETIMDDTQVTKGPQHWFFNKKRFVVLVDSFSASASEMLIAALKDGFSRHGNTDTVVIVGETTYGKGIGQICIKRDYLHRQDIKITFMRMKGVTARTGSYHEKGIEPDVVIHDRKQQEEAALKILEPSARLKKEPAPPSYTIDSDNLPAEVVITAPLGDNFGADY